MKQDRLRIDDISVALRRAGTAGPAIVLCHGNSASSRAFQRQLESDLSARFRLIAVDLPGHGDSDRATNPETTYTLPGYARVLAEVTRQLDVARAIFVGWSLGGHVVLEASAQLSEAAGFFIFGTPPLGVPPALDRAFLPDPAVAAAFRDGSTDEVIRAFLGCLVAPGVAVPSFFDEDFHRTDGRARAALAASVARNELRDEVLAVGAMSRPLAIIHGERDRLVNRAYLDELVLPTLWRGAVQDLPGIGHAPQWEDPDAFNRLLEAFARDCGATA